ncbi:hypothetical protein EYF80_008033 [Liparis tanakae]|uniref:Uncharacterized protein n=1 Tax=Liparis tanakae TaxID=230148 RepID=A0A4Z2IV15_9TELE|nr:hypothetical protein EYF80_008033 [Liparis tanakae]
MLVLHLDPSTCAMTQRDEVSRSTVTFYHKRSSRHTAGHSSTQTVKRDTLQEPRPAATPPRRRAA